mmetsp:Transcript_20978/g.65813  ORF Transcript_20978/g.65813 Transcript_20978/m.65813 type:complete len:256 (-) Transcript_20978:31-798(-)
MGTAEAGPAHRCSCKPRWSSAVEPSSRRSSKWARPEGGMAPPTATPSGSSVGVRAELAVTVAWAGRDVPASNTSSQSDPSGKEALRQKAGVSQAVPRVSVATPPLPAWARPSSCDGVRPPVALPRVTSWMSTRSVSAAAAPLATAAVNVIGVSGGCETPSRKRSGWAPSRSRCGTPSCKSMAVLAASCGPSSRRAETREGDVWVAPALKVTRVLEPAARVEQKPPPAAPPAAPPPALAPPAPVAVRLPCNAVKHR